MNQTWQELWYKKALEHKSFIIRLFKLLYGLLIAFIAFGVGSTFLNKESFDWFNGKSVLFGEAALILLGIVLLPGILGRFSIEIKVTRIITTYRRQLGILTFLLALTHYIFVRLLGYVTGVFPFKLPFPLFEIMGMSALFIMSLLFLTSNNTSIKKLGKWWKRLHRLIYIIVWLVVLHTGLQRISIWTLLIGVFAVLETVSLIYSITTKKRI